MFNNIRHYEYYENCDIFLFRDRNHPLARECDIVETLHMRLTLLQMTFGKHIERKHVCFFAGEVSKEIKYPYKTTDIERIIL